MYFIYLEPANGSVRLMSNLHIAPSNIMIVGGATVTSPNSLDVKLWQYLGFAPLLYGWC